MRARGARRRDQGPGPRQLDLQAQGARGADAAGRLLQQAPAAGRPRVAHRRPRQGDLQGARRAARGLDLVARGESPGRARRERRAGEGLRRRVPGLPAARGRGSRLRHRAQPRLAVSPQGLAAERHRGRDPGDQRLHELAARDLARGDRACARPGARGPGPAGPQGRDRGQAPARRCEGHAHHAARPRQAPRGCVPRASHARQRAADRGADDVVRAAVPGPARDRARRGAGPRGRAAGCSSPP